SRLQTTSRQMTPWNILLLGGVPGKRRIISRISPARATDSQLRTRLDMNTEPPCLRKEGSAHSIFSLYNMYIWVALLSIPFSLENALFAEKVSLLRIHSRIKMSNFVRMRVRFPGISGTYG
ncbi:MAG: hypothetical protein AB1696_09945, partial [Planctomycetota bacterium]